MLKLNYEMKGAVKDIFLWNICWKELIRKSIKEWEHKLEKNILFEWKDTINGSILYLPNSYIFSILPLDSLVVFLLPGLGVLNLTTNPCLSMSFLHIWYWQVLGFYVNQAYRCLRFICYSILSICSGCQQSGMILWYLILTCKCKVKY